MKQANCTAWERHGDFGGLCSNPQAKFNGLTVGFSICRHCDHRLPVNPTQPAIVQLTLPPHKSPRDKSPHGNQHGKHGTATSLATWRQRGPHYWAKLHRWSLMENPGDADRWLNQFTAAMPAGCECRPAWRASIARSPFPTQAETQADTRFAWTVDRHNEVNARLGKPTMDLDSATQIWDAGGPLKRAVIVGNWFGDKMRPNSRASIQAAAKRWGVSYVESTMALSATGKNGYAEKLLIDLHAAQYDQVVYLDRDIVVRSDCPSPFDRVPLHAFGAVPSYQEPGHDWRHAADRHLKPIFSRAKVPFDASRDHFNGGLYVFSPALHGWIFHAARELASRERDRHWSVYEEGLVSLAAIQWSMQSGQSIVRLDRAFNFCGDRVRQNWVPEMASWIQHYCGDHHRRDARMDATIWDLRDLRSGDLGSGDLARSAG